MYRARNTAIGIALAAAVSAGAALAPTQVNAMIAINTTAQGSITDFIPLLAPDGVGDQLSMTFMDVRHNTTIGFQVRESRAFMEYDLSAVTGPVSQATITINTTNGASGKAIDVYGYTGNGTLELGDFPLGAFVTSFVAPAVQTTIDVTAFINTQVTGGSAFAGFNLRLQQEDTSYISQFGTTTTNYPLLTVDLATNPGGGGGTTIPEPGMLALFGLGLAGLGYVRRRKASAE